MLTTVEEARRVASQISELSRQIREIPGLDGGHVARLYASLNNLIQDYGQRPYWHYRFMRRELDEIAAEVKRLAAGGELVAEHLELFDLALYRLKNRRFRTATKLLLKVKDGASLVQERERLREEYRPFRRGLEERARALEEEVRRLREVPSPEAGPGEVAAVEEQIARCNAASAAALRGFLARAPAREVLRLSLRMGAEPGLRFLAPPGPQDAEPLLRLLEAEADAGGLARRDIYGLMEAAGYTEARLSHLTPGAKRLRLLLQANAPWLRSLSRVEEAGAVSVSPREPPEALRERIPPLLRLLSEVPGAEEAVRRLRELHALVESGRFAAIQRSAELYRRHGEGARKRWEGSLEAEISGKERALEEVRRDLRDLPPPEAL